MINAPDGPAPDTRTLSAAELLARGRALQVAGWLPDALECLGAAIDRGRAAGDADVVAEALRWFAVVHQQQGEPHAAVGYAMQSVEAATAASRSDLAAAALCTAGGIALETGDLDVARTRYEQARQLGASDPALAARTESNLGILAAIAGSWQVAERHYGRALADYEATGDERGAGEVLHNLAMLHADRREWSEAVATYRRASTAARHAGDDRLAALCALNEADVHLATGEYDAARRLSEQALRAFDRLNAVADKPDAYRIQGQVFRALGLPTLAESRIRAAIQAATATRNPLSEAEASVALADLLSETDRSDEATECRTRARALFQRVGAAVPALC